MLRFVVYLFLIVLVVATVVNTHTSFYRVCDDSRKYAQLVRDYVLEPLAETGDSNNLLLALQKVKQSQHALRLLSDQVGGVQILSKMVGHDLGHYSFWMQSRCDTYMSLIAQQAEAAPTSPKED